MTATVELLFTGKDDTGSAFGGILGNLGNMGNIVTGIKSAFDLAGQAIDAAVGLFTPFVDSASESEQAIVGLNTVLKSTGDSIGLTSQQLQDMATQLQGVTRYSDEQVTAAEAMLLRYENINQNIFPEAIRLTTDLASSLGIDLTAAARQIGMALDDPASGIGRLNTQFRLFNETEMENIKTMAEHGDIAGAQAIIMDRLREKVGGAAEAYGNTFAGQLDIAKNSIDNIAESIGGVFLPKLTEMLKGLNDFINSPIVQDFTIRLVNALSTGDFSTLDSYVGNVISVLKTKIQNWVDGGGPQELADKFIVFLDKIGTGDETDSKTKEALKRLATSLKNAVDKVDWNELGIKLDEAIARLISNQDWSGSGTAFGDAVEKFFTEGWDKGVDQGSKSIGTKSSNALQEGIKTFLVNAIGGPEAAAYWKSAFDNLMTTNLDQIVITVFKGLFFDVGAKVGQWFIDSFRDKINERVKDFFTIPVDAPIAQFFQIGKDVMQGLHDGMNEQYWYLIGRIVIWFADIGKTAKKILGIASPSTVFFDIGVNIIQGLIDGFLSLLPNWNGILGGALTGKNSTSGSTLGGTAGGSVGGSAGGALSSGTVVNNFYGPVYFGSAGAPGAYYDCPSPHPLVAASGNQLVQTGF